MLTKKNQDSAWCVDIFLENNCSHNPNLHKISHQLKKQQIEWRVPMVSWGNPPGPRNPWPRYHCLKVSISSAVMDLWFTPYLDFAKCLLQIFQRALDSYRKAPWKLCSLKDLQTSSPIPFNELGFSMIFPKRRYHSSDSVDFGPSKSNPAQELSKTVH